MTQPSVGVPDIRAAVPHSGQTLADEARSLSLAASIRQQVYELYSVWDLSTARDNDDDEQPSWRRVARCADEADSSIRDCACAAAALGSAVETFSVDLWKPRANDVARTLIGLLDAALGAGSDLKSLGDRPNSLVGLDVILAAGQALAMCGRVTGDLTLTERAADLVSDVYQNASDPVSGGGVAEAVAGTARPAYDLRIQLAAMAACLSLVQATGAMEWRRRGLDLSIFVVARFFNPTDGSVRAKYCQTPEDEIEKADSALTFDTSSILSEASVILEEPALSDVAGRLVWRATGIGSREADCKSRLNADVERRLEAITLPGLHESAAALHALAHHYARRPSVAILELLETEWHTVLTGLSALVDRSRRPGSNLTTGSTTLRSGPEPVGCDLCEALLCAAAMLTLRGHTS